VCWRRPELDAGVDGDVATGSLTVVYDRMDRKNSDRSMADSPPGRVLRVGVVVVIALRVVGPLFIVGVA
jgi:hypothetical protein